VLSTSVGGDQHRDCVATGISAAGGLGNAVATHESLAPRDARSGVVDRLKDTRVKPESFCV